MPLLIAKTKGIDILFAYLFEYIKQAVLVWCICIQELSKVRGGSHQVGSDSVENPGWLFDIGDYTTQLYGDYNMPI